MIQLATDMKLFDSHFTTLAASLSDPSLKSEVPFSAEQILQHESALLNQHRHAVDTVGLALSGGGIRSATFNLGVLQALCGYSALSKFDYLSAVSGGSYIAAWLVSWIRRTNVKEVETALAITQRSGLREPPEVTFLRQYSNYLTPRAGGFSLDTWAMVAIYLRNLALTLSVIVAVVAFSLLVPRFVLTLMRPGMLNKWWGLDERWSSFNIELILMGVGIVLLIYTYSLFRQERIFARPFVWSLFVFAHLITHVLYFGALQATITAAVQFAMAAQYIFSPPYYSSMISLSFLVVCVCVYLTAQRGVMPVVTALSSTWRAIAKGAVSVVAFLIFLFLCVESASLGSELMGVVGRLQRPSTFLVTFTAGVLAIVWCGVMLATFVMGFLGNWVSEQTQEALGRLSGDVLLFGFKWGVLSLFSLFAPMMVYSSSSSAARALLLAIWLLPTFISVLMIFENAPFFRWMPEGTREVILNFSPYVFLGGLLTTISWMLSRFVFDIRPSPSMGYLDLVFQSLDPKIIAYMALFGLTALAFSARFGINHSSLHLFYRNRLIRAYLGASNRNRKPGRYTGFDSNDDTRLAALRPDAGYTGPYPIFNATLNLVRGEQLAWQERKAANFTFAPLYCGYDTGQYAVPEYPDLHHFGFRPTQNYAHDRAGISLGMAMALSGAAISTNMGYHTSPRTGFLMSVFNVRLGWWLSNPRHSTSWNQAGPRSRINMLWQEFFAGTTDTWPYVYISDGGHFENLGVYELVRRKVGLIIVSDASFDPDTLCSDLGNAVEKCRADLGFDIAIDVAPIRQGIARVAVGTIDYGKDRPTGALVYIKPRLMGNEPADVISYSLRHPAFPHDSTANQWFMESHFESYRVLGEHIGRQAVSILNSDGSLLALGLTPDIVKSIRAIWGIQHSGSVGSATAAH
jgi:Patatin-like phospholipase